jgi:hypothetical protein
MTCLLAPHGDCCLLQDGYIFRFSRPKHGSSMKVPTWTWTDFSNFVTFSQPDILSSFIAFQRTETRSYVSTLSDRVTAQRYTHSSCEPPVAHGPRKTLFPRNSLLLEMSFDIWLQRVP